MSSPLKVVSVIFNHINVTCVLFPRYFEDDEEESSSNVDLPYIPAENSPTRQQMQAGGGSDSEDDPLDAFMSEVEVRGALLIAKVLYSLLICRFIELLLFVCRTKPPKT